MKAILTNASPGKKKPLKVPLRVIKMKAFMIAAICLLPVVAAFSQNVTFSGKNVSVEKVFASIKSQTGYTFWYNVELVEKAKKIDVSISNKPLKEALDICFDGLPFTYEIVGKAIVVKERAAPSAMQAAYKKDVPPPTIITVHGTVVDDNGEPLSGVTIILDGTNNNATTGADGKFSLNAAEGGVLSFSFVGYTTQRVNVGTKTTIDIKLIKDVKALDDIVVVGYGTVRKTDLTGAVSSIRSDQLKTTGANTVTKALQGRLAGVQIESAGGSPGAGVRVLIRGVGTWNNNDPLYIVDGVQVTNVDNLNPNDIASMNILKDASAAAIYGSRAANGVVLVTTHSGKAGKTSIQVDAYAGVQKLPRTLDVLNGTEYARMNNAAHDAAGIPRQAIFSNPDSIGVGTNWQDQIYRTAPIQSYTLSMSGGKAGSIYSVSLGYFDQDGIVKQTGYKRLNLRAKSETTKGRFTFGETVILSQENRKQMPGGWGGQGGNPVGAAAVMIPIFKVYDDKAIGGYGGAYGPVVNVENPLAELNLQTIRNDAVNAVVNAYGKVDLAKGLFYKLNLGYTHNSGYRYDFSNRYTVGTLFTNPTNNLSEGSDRRRFYMVENTLNYEKELGKHRIQALVGYTMQKSTFRTTNSSAQDLPDGITVLDAASGTRFSSGSLTESSLVSMLGRAVYSYNDRYLLTASIRRDGSSRFAPSNRYGNFPSVAVGWNISKEGFFSGLSSTVSQLKLRGSYGVLGNQEFADYAYMAAIASNQNYAVGTGQNLWFGAIQTAFTDPNFKWENTETFNIGLDLTLFKKINFTADFYNKKTSDILLGLPIPGSAGASNDPITNAGILRNTGLELSLSYAGGKTNFKYNVFGTLSTNKNKVLKLSSGQPLFGGRPTHHGSSTTTTMIGGSVGAFYLIQPNGIFNTVEEVQAHKNKDGKLIQPNAKPGDIRFLDANGDGLISDKDKVYSGSAFPKISYGFGFNGSWKILDFSTVFQGTYGNKIYNGLRMSLESTNLMLNWDKSVLNAWTADNYTDIPRAVINDPNNNNRTSARFLESGGYLRMRTLQMGLNFEPPTKGLIPFSSLRAYISFDNLFTITNYTGYNPDLGRPGSILDRGVDLGQENYPLARTATIGVQLGF